MKCLIIYKCPICGNIICMLEDSGVVPVCCGKEMMLLEENTVEAVHEKHIPVLLCSGTNVQISVGEVMHPMTAQHYISHIFLLTDSNLFIRRLSFGDTPGTVFRLGENEKILAAYALCNLHGLWKCNV